MLSNLCASLGRASEHFAGAHYKKTDEGFEASFQIQMYIPNSARKAASAYIREYVKQSGWKVSSLRFDKKQMRMEAQMRREAKPASKSESRISRNFNATACGSKR
jgi:hypothetical protein